MADTIKVPYGVDPSGNLTASTDADKGREYRCPGCNSPLILKEGEIRTKHFSHKSDSHCNFETVLHITAKGLVSQAIKSNSAGTTNISVRNHCLTLFLVDLSFHAMDPTLTSNLRLQNIGN